MDREGKEGYGSVKFIGRDEDSERNEDFSEEGRE